MLGLRIGGCHSECEKTTKQSGPAPFAERKMYLMKIKLFSHQLKTSAVALAACVALASAANAANEFGSGAGNHTLTADDNTANGYDAFFYDATGNDNVAEGAFSLLQNTGGSGNAAVGFSSLYNNTSGNLNVANGNQALYSNITGGYNVANGANALYANTNGNYNTANGNQALAANVTGTANTANGNNALAANTTGSYNTADGPNALQNNTTGSGNTALGYSSGNALTTGDDNIDIGNTGVAGESNTIRIGTTNVQTATYVAGINGVTVPDTANAVVVDSVTGQLGTASPGSLLISGAYLFLPTSQAAPAGFTKVAVWSASVKSLAGKNIKLNMNVYQKN